MNIDTKYKVTINTEQREHVGDPHPILSDERTILPSELMLTPNTESLLDSRTNYAQIDHTITVEDLANGEKNVVYESGGAHGWGWRIYQDTIQQSNLAADYYKENKSFINLTQHDPMPAQVEAGVTNLPAEQVTELKKLLTFNSAPTQEEMQDRAEKIAALAKAAGADRAMIGGAAYSMPALEEALEAQGITPTYAFTELVARGNKPDGSINRVLEHKGFIDAPERGHTELDLPALAEIKGAKILNLMKFPASPEQVADGVVEPTDKKTVGNLVTVEGTTPPTVDELKQRASKLAEIASEALKDEPKKIALIGGLPLYMVGAVEEALGEKGIKPVHSFSERVVIGEKQTDNGAEKVFGFKHTGFVESGAGKNPKGLGNEGAEDLSAPDRRIARN